MPRPGISKALVIQTIDDLVRNGESLTVMKVREYLGTGSLSTIQRYVKEWKMQSFNNSVAKEPINNIVTHNNVDHAKEFESLKQQLEQLSGQNQLLSAELIKVEQANIRLTQDNDKFSRNLNELTESYKNLLLEYNSLNSKYQELNAERESAISKILLDKNTQIKRLEQEIKTINEQYLAAVKEVGRYGDDKLILEKVKTVNLTEQIKHLQENNKILEQQLSAAKKVKEPLINKIKYQEDLISKFITWEQIQQYANQDKELADD